MKEVNNIWVGRLDTSIRVLIIDSPQLINPFSYVLITSIDSSRNLKTLTSVKQVVTDFPESTFSEGGLIVEAEVFHKLLSSYDLFNGFDEIWLFLSPPATVIPSTVWLTGPLEVDNELPEDLEKWMKNSGCTLGLGDGIGLNYVTTDKSIANFLRNHTFAAKERRDKTRK